MSTLLTESLAFWLVVAGACFFCGFALATGLAKRQYMFVGGVVALCLLTVGIVLVFFVDTDAKSVRRSIDALVAAVGRDDVEGVLEYVAPNAERTRRLATFNMGLANIERAKIGNFKIREITRTTSPPRARVSLRGVVAGKAASFDAYPFTVMVDFTKIELRLGQDGVWRVTDECEFRYPGYATEGARDDDFDAF